MAESYKLALAEPELASAWSSISEQSVNRFLHIPESPQDLVTKNKMQRRMGQLTGTCFRAVQARYLERIALNHDIDQAHGTEYHQRLKFLKRAQINNLIVGAGMTDPKATAASVRATMTISLCTSPVAPMPVSM